MSIEGNSLLFHATRTSTSSPLELLNRRKIFRVFIRKLEHLCGCSQCARVHKMWSALLTIFSQVAQNSKRRDITDS